MAQILAELKKEKRHCQSVPRAIWRDKRKGKRIGQEMKIEAWKGDKIKEGRNELGNWKARNQKRKKKKKEVCLNVAGFVLM